MIRDPSDGSVREKADVETLGKSAAANRSTNNSKELISTSTSGLPFGSTKPEHIQRLEKSRSQLKNYRKTGVWDDATG